MLNFFHTNIRWLGVGFLLTFASAFGQTWFISLFADFIKAEYALTDGSWGGLYTGATLSAAALMFLRGSVADTVGLSGLAPVMTIIFACAALGMAAVQSVWMLGIVLFLLRFCGQGMFTHIAMTAMGRWFEARRGQAVSIAALGHPAGEIVIPLLAVLMIGALGWRQTWIAVAAVLLLVVTPALLVLLSEGRSPAGHADQTPRPGLMGRQWRRSDAVRHWLLPALLPILLTPGFISTVIYFHQAHVATVKGWSLVEMAPGYTAFGISSVIAAFATGWAADQVGPQRLLPVLLIPMGFGVALLGPASHVVTWYVVLGSLGMTLGIASSLWGVLFPVLYGTVHLGAIRSLATTIMVISTAIGPGITGVLIDHGVDLPVQSRFMSLWCFAMVGFCWLILRRLNGDLAEARS